MSGCHTPQRCGPHGTPFDVSKDCRTCWLYANNSQWNQALGGDGFYEGPNVWIRAANFTRALTSHLMTGGKKVAPLTLQMRKEACENCEFYKPQSGRCGHEKCGCFIRTKASWQSEDCPVGKWSKTRPSIKFDAANLYPELGGWRLNPSLAVNPAGGYFFAFRSGWDGSRIHLCRLNEEFQPQDCRPLELKHPEACTQEDPRLFWFRGRLHVAFCGGRMMRTSVLYARLDDDAETVERVFYPHYAGRRTWEKNWSFFEHNNELFAVYSTTPHRVLKIDGNVAMLAHQTETQIDWKGGEIRGGASPVLHEGEWYHFFHDRIQEGRNKRQYRTGLLTFAANPPFPVQRMIINPIIEANPKDNPGNYADVLFVGGAVLQHGQWLLAQGCHDRWAQIDFLSAASLERRLTTVPI